jgi:hypothetical protein
MSALHDRAPPPDHDRNPPPPAEPSQSAGVLFALQSMTQYLSTIESKVEKLSAKSKLGVLEFLIELSKVFFGGWPAFGFLFLLIFYAPLTQTLNEIPSKIKSADEFSVGVASFKRSIVNSAERIGAINLSTTLPNLSPRAIDLLLRTPMSEESLIAFAPNEDQDYNSVDFPSTSFIGTISEFKEKGLVSIC